MGLGDCEWCWDYCGGHCEGAYAARGQKPPHVIIDELKAEVSRLEDRYKEAYRLGYSDGYADAIGAD